MSKTSHLSQTHALIQVSILYFLQGTLNTIGNIKNTNKNIKNGIGKKHNKIPNLILAV